jgi:hypothetical protein
MKKIASSIVLIAIACTSFAQGSIEGAYERVSLINTRTGASPEAANRRGLLILAHGHYSMMTMNPERRVISRDEQVDEWPSDEQIAYYKEWLDINGHTGRYEIDGEKLILYRDISEDPKEVGTVSKLGFEQKDDLLIIFFSLPNGDRYDWIWRRLQQATD